jgi:hypothetical protein
MQAEPGIAPDRGPVEAGALPAPRPGATKPPVASIATRIAPRHRTLALLCVAASALCLSSSSRSAPRAGAVLGRRGVRSRRCCCVELFRGVPRALRAAAPLAAAPSAAAVS